VICKLFLFLVTSTNATGNFVYCAMQYIFRILVIVNGSDDGVFITLGVTEFLGFVHPLIFQDCSRFWKLDLFPPSGERMGRHLLSCICQREPIPITERVLEI
jgi:hypothetical protein